MLENLRDIDLSDFNCFSFLTFWAFCLGQFGQRDALAL